MSFVNCKEIGDITHFEENQGNLIASQTVFEVPQTFNAATVKVYKNDTLLTVTTDYVVTDSDTITLNSGVLVTDKVDIVTPTTVAFEIANHENIMIGCYSRDAVTKLGGSGTYTATLLRGPNRLGANWINIIDGAAGTAARLQAVGETNSNLELFGAGTGGVTLRCRDARSLVADNPASAVNWLGVTGAVADGYVGFSGQGSSSNVGIIATPKGNLNFRIGANTLACPHTITAPGTTGNQTINKMKGRVNIAAAGTTITVTNNLVSTSSMIDVQVAANDATAQIMNVVPGSGSFVVNMAAAVTAETPIDFAVLNGF